MKEYLEDADAIIAVLRVPRKIARGDKRGRPLDLSHKRRELAYLLEEAHEVYQTALDDWEARLDPLKPKRRLEDNWSKNEEELPADEFTTPLDVAQKEWEEFWQQWYFQPTKNPGRARFDASLSIGVLHPVYFLIRYWWKKHVGQPFTGDFNFKEGSHGVDQRTEDYFAPGARLFYRIATHLNYKYTASNCHWVHDALRKRIKPEK